MSEHVRMWIGGDWVDAEGGATFEATSPSTGEVIGTVPEGTRADARRAVAAANPPAIAYGNAVVWAPAPTTSVCAARFAECLEAADLPPGVVNMVTGPGPVVGDEIAANPDTQAVGFIGSIATGLTVAQRGAGKELL